jgi:hypothetical protein
LTVYIFILAFLASLLFLNISLVYGSENKISIPYMAQTPTIDGVWTTEEEWNTASETLKSGITSGMKLFIRTGYDNEFIYVLLDFVSDINKGEFDWAIICFAPSQDGHFDTFHCFRSIATNQTVIYAGNGDPPTFSSVQNIPEGFQTVSSFSSQNDPYSKEPHMIYEFKIPIKYIGSAASYRFYTQATDLGSGKMLVWPDPAVDAERLSYPDIHIPEVWGIIESPNGTVPEFPLTAYYTLLVSVALVILLARFFSPRSKLKLETL